MKLCGLRGFPLRPLREMVYALRHFHLQDPPCLPDFEFRESILLGKELKHDIVHTVFGQMGVPVLRQKNCEIENGLDELFALAEFIGPFFKGLGPFALVFFNMTSPVP